MDFSKALELNPEYSDAYAIRGLTLMGQGEYDRALWDLNRALQLNPHHPYANAIRGSLYLNKGDLVRAVRDFDEALTRTPDNNIAYNYRGLAYEQKGDLARAMQDYDQALSIRPDQTVFACRGIALLRLSRWDEAKSDLLSARNMGMDLVSVFRADHGSVAAFEEKNNLKLPQDIANLVSVEEAPQPGLHTRVHPGPVREDQEVRPSDTWDELPPIWSRTRNITFTAIRRKRSDANALRRLRPLGSRSCTPATRLMSGPRRLLPGWDPLQSLRPRWRWSRRSTTCREEASESGIWL